MKLKSTHNLFLFALLFLASCAVTRQSETRTLRASESQVIPKTMVGEVEIDVTKSIAGEAVVTNGDVNEAKALAKWNALQSSGAHIIIDPVFKIHQMDLTVRVEVKGYYGKFSSIETATEQDLLDFITVKLLTGNGLLDVPYNQFRFYYYSLAENQQLDPDLILSEEELLKFYLNELYGDRITYNVPASATTNTNSSSNSSAPSNMQEMLDQDFNLTEIRSRAELKQRTQTFKSWSFAERKAYNRAYLQRRGSLTPAEKKQLRKKASKETSPAIKGLLAVELIALIAIPVVIIMNY